MSFEKIEAICGKEAADELRLLKSQVDELRNGPFAGQQEPKKTEKTDAKTSK